jgi:hypothetical protein
MGEFGDSSTLNDSSPRAFQTNSLLASLPFTDTLPISGWKTQFSSSLTTPGGLRQ